HHFNALYWLYCAYEDCSCMHFGGPCRNIQAKVVAICQVDICPSDLAKHDPVSWSRTQACMACLIIVKAIGCSLYYCTGKPDRHISTFYYAHQSRANKISCHYGSRLVIERDRETAQR